MRIRCPFCGERDHGEFTYLGDAGVRRPLPDLPNAEEDYHAAIYLRDNPAGPHEELWFHTAGCHSWLRVRRDTLSHEILNIGLAKAARAS